MALLLCKFCLYINSSKFLLEQLFPRNGMCSKNILNINLSLEVTVLFIYLYTGKVIKLLRKWQMHGILNAPKEITLTRK